MKWINNIPVSAWLLITLVLVYATWNPTEYSLYDYIVHSDGLKSGRLLTGAVLLALYAIYLHESYQTFSVLGLVIFVVIIGAALWLAIDLGVLRPDSTTAWRWLTPALFSVILWLGLQGGRMYRGATGRMPVSVDHHPAQDGGHHGHV
jgi:hypothetical protein